MGEFIQAIGSGVAGLITGALQTIGAVLRGMTETMNTVLPGGLLGVVAFFALLAGAWVLAKR
ncbi:MAG TPA: hypothetical protein VFV72_16975 [Candidatus Limnocylindrales bacterium]|nr:hypothetical protein [Candidatus Limnocylindrales bacterium]